MILAEPQEGPHQSHLSNQIKAGFVKTLRYPGCRQLAECELVDDYREDRLLQARARWLSGAVQSEGAIVLSGTEASGRGKTDAAMQQI